MQIRFLVNEVHGGWSPESTRLGGTEESIIEWAKILRGRGHTVTVYHNGLHGTWDDVRYLPREDYRGGDGVTVNCKAWEVPPVEPTIYFTNETDIDKRDVSRYDMVVVPSFWARDNLKINNPKVEVVYHGYDPSEIYPGEKVPGTVLYASSPDRGLRTLLEVWPEVYRRHPSALLIVTYGVTGVSAPGLVPLGDVDRETMADLFRTSEIWCHPCSGGELFGITAVKAQAAGCVPVYFPTMALSETVKQGVRSEPATLLDDLVLCLQDRALRSEVREALAQEHFVDWEESTDELEALIKEIT